MDDDGQLTIVDITCTHLGCELNWNNAERSWDCPCHGGRFNFDGRLLEGPPSNPLKILHQDKPAT
jgi:Rieske Fe-S protein